nr:hypothetical protein BaRGS_002636 [Batillaria attramentaria]
MDAHFEVMKSLVKSTEDSKAGTIFVKHGDGDEDDALTQADTFTWFVVEGNCYGVSGQTRQFSLASSTKCDTTSVVDSLTVLDAMAVYLDGVLSADTTFWVGAKKISAPETVQEIVEKLQKELTVDKTTLSKTTRKKISVQDERTSAVATVYYSCCYCFYYYYYY